ncbi:MAG: hypothetical protein MRT15_01615 [archaeon YNP-LCB-003-016]|jgi:hypothetical protein|uniref:hypothetical protein n=1 Tax=Candidatus Culexarchaeum yellowstonense TaxID=2928963 RepID=UPI0026EB25BA|nr:hypothetical protein [Candidatus Culexarchaeum yellowstonense]MCR6691066.1 hypothetical protein [Candidatus Culexarchaeum yellowstonense]
MPYPSTIDGIIGAWVGAFLTLAIYSYILYKETKVYRFAEYLYVGSAFAVALTISTTQIYKQIILRIASGQYIYIVGVILGLMLLTLPFKSVRWISRYTVMFLMGLGFGVTIRGALTANIIAQIRGSITPPGATATALDWFNFAWICLGTLLVISYFTFTVEHTGWYFYPTKLGRYILLVGLGAYYGNTVQFRMTMLAGRVQYLLQVFKIIPWP